MVEYPNELRLPLVSGYSREVEPGFKQTEPLSGPVYNVRRSFDNPVRWQVQFHFTGGQQRLFWQWFRDALDDGLRPFAIPLKIEAGIAVQECKFASDGIPRLTSVQGDHYRYTATLLSRKINDPDEGMYDWLVYLAESGSARKAAHDIDFAVNVEWPEA